MYKVIVMLSCFLLQSRGDVRNERSIYFPTASLAGIFAALAVPAGQSNDGNVQVYSSLYLKANYYLPANSTEFGEADPFLSSITVSKQLRSSLTRQSVYNYLEQKLESHGLEGRACLLRCLCEAAQATFSNSGLLGTLLHIVLTPSTSKKENLNSAFYISELEGRAGSCGNYEKRCPFKLLDLISYVI